MRYDYYPRDGLVAIDPSKLRYWRDYRFFTREELAEDCGVSRLTIRSWELGTRTPSAENFRRLVTALGIDPAGIMLYGSRYREPDTEE
jgi:transcriptional regulator with XRE-family HTH domain